MAFMQARQHLHETKTKGQHQLNSVHVSVSEKVQQGKNTPRAKFT